MVIEILNKTKESNFLLSMIPSMIGAVTGLLIALVGARLTSIRERKKAEEERRERLVLNLLKWSLPFIEAGNGIYKFVTSETVNEKSYEALKELSKDHEGRKAFELRTILILYEEELNKELTEVLLQLSRISGFLNKKRNGEKINLEEFIETFNQHVISRSEFCEMVVKRAKRNS